MLKKSLFTLTLTSLLFAENLPYTMYANKVVKDGNIVEADGGVMIYHDKSVYKADGAIYDTYKKRLKLYGNVTTITNSTIVRHNSLEIDIDSKRTTGDKFFIYDGREGLWIRGGKYDRNDTIIVARNSEVSSCDVEKPDWKITFKKAKYNKKTEFMTIQKPTFYFKGHRVFGLPWFAFPTVRHRKSGLLRPTFGAQVDSGFVFMQPYFYAPQKNWDIEFVPQVRTKRGFGLYSTLSFADTKYSKGSITIGSFYDRDSFVTDKNLKNSSHYGMDLSYQSDRVFENFLSDKNSKDGLWVDLHYLNDVDYENLKDISVKSLNKLVTSRFNYFLKRDRDYFGVYSKYFIDTDKESNSDTMQELPTLQYHKFTTNLPFKNLIYSIDYKVTNNYRKKGLNAAWHEINLPIKLDIPLAGNFLNFSISENLYYSKIKYSNRDSSNIEDASYYSNYHKFILSSDLMKEYDSFIHNLQLESSLQVPSFEDKSGYFADFININKEEKNLKLSANQYFYNYGGFNFLTLRTSQVIYIKRDKDKYGDIENEIEYNHSKHLSLSENIDFSSKYNKIKKIQTILKYDDDDYSFYLSHTHQNVPNLSKINYLTTNFSLNLNNNYKISTNLDYDIEKSITRDWSLKLFRDKKCWNYSIKYKESITPIFTSGGARSYKNRGLYFLVNFANIGGISYEYSKDKITDDLGGVSDE